MTLRLDRTLAELVKTEQGSVISGKHVLAHLQVWGNGYPLTIDVELVTHHRRGFCGSAQLYLDRELGLTVEDFWSAFGTAYARAADGTGSPQDREAISEGRLVRLADGRLGVVQDVLVSTKNKQSVALVAPLTEMENEVALLDTLTLA